MKMTDAAQDLPESSLRSRRKFLKETGLAVAAGAAVLVGCAPTFWLEVLGFLKALVWPTLLVYEALKYLNM